MGDTFPPRGSFPKRAWKRAGSAAIAAARFHYEAPFAFTGTLKRVIVTMDDDQELDSADVGRSQMARQ
jgi:hypothetical protein